MNPEHSKTPRQLARQRYELKHPFSDRYKANPEYFRKRSRDAKRAQRKFVDAAELDACIEDIRKAKTIRGDDWIVCLGRRVQRCGQMLKALRARGAGAHLIQHGFSDGDQYRDHWGYNRSTSLTCNAVATKASLKAKSEGHLNAEVGLGNLRRPQKGSVVVSKEARLNNRDSQTGRRNTTSSKGVRDVQFVRPWLLEDKSIEEIAANVGLSESGVRRNLQRIFRLLVKGQVRFAHGEILTRNFADQLSDRFSFGKKEIMKKYGLAIHQVQFPKKHRTDRALTPEAAGVLLEAEQQLLREIIEFGGNGPAYFRRTVPQLDFLYEQTRQTIKAIRDTPDISILIGRLCDESRKALPGEACPARTALCLLRALVPLLEMDSATLPFVLAQQFIAGDFGVSDSVVEIALRLGKTQSLPTPESIGAILRASMSQDRRPQKKKPVGRSKGMSEDRVKEAQHLLRVIAENGGKRGAVKLAAKAVYRGISPDLAYDRARQTLKDYRNSRTKHREKN